MTSEVINVTSSSSLPSRVSADCTSYQLCLRRRLIYHSVVFLGPTVCVTFSLEFFSFFIQPLAATHQRCVLGPVLGRASSGTVLKPF